MLITELATRASFLGSSKLPEPVIKQATRHVADSLGALLLGSSNLSERLVAHANALGLDGLPGSGGIMRRTAYVGAVYTHAWEVDDMHRESVVCPGCIILPTLLAGLERMPGLTWEKFLRAFVVGYEVTIAAALRCDSSSIISAGWWPTSIFGPIGGAAALSVMLNKSQADTASALGLASQQAGGMVVGQTTTADSRYLLAGIAADRAVSAVISVESGWTGPEDVFDLQRTPIRAHRKTMDESGFLIASTSRKMYPAAMHLHAAIEIVINLVRTSRLRPADIMSLECRLPRQIAAAVDHPAPFMSTLGTLVSGQFVLASAIIAGRLTVEEYNTSSRADPEILALALRIRIVADDELAARYPQEWGSNVEIFTFDGKRLFREKFIAAVDDAADSSAAVQRSKFVSQTTNVLGLEVGTNRFSSLINSPPNSVATEVFGRDVLSIARGEQPFKISSNVPSHAPIDALTKKEEI